MIAILISAAVVCVGSLVLGQGLLALCGAARWSWLAAPVGLSLLILIAVPALHLPGRSTTVAVIAGLLILAALVFLVRRPVQRPSPGELLAGLPVALLALVPFLASGRSGTLGVSFDNDMATHLLYAEAYRSHAVAAITPLAADYPLGPHALAAMLAQGLGLRVDRTFAGLTMATPLLLGWTALAVVPRARWLVKCAVATIVGMPFLIAAFYGEGAFKEPIVALFVLTTALMLAGCLPELGRWRWVPLALVLAGSVSVYSLQGLAWPVAFIAVWLVGRAALEAWKSGWRKASRELLSELVPGAIGVGVLVVVLIPQIPRVEKFVSHGVAYTIVKTNLGNLAGPISGWEAFGAWGNPDFRFAPSSPFTAGMWTALALALALLGAFSALRQRRWILPASAVVAVLAWAYIAHTQSPYIAANALAIASPLLLLLVGMGVAFSDVGQTGRLVLVLVSAALVIKIADSSLQALRVSEVGPTAHLAELRSLRPALGAQPTLFLGDDDFIEWELAGARVTPAYFAGTPEVPLRPQKAFAYGQPLDFDTVAPEVLNQFDWVITTRDAAGSEAPAGMQLARLTRDYALWRRVGQIAPRAILDEGPAPGAVLDCRNPAGRALAAHAGQAALRPAMQEVPVPPLGPGQSATVSLHLGSGRWSLETPYLSPLPVTVTAGGLSRTLPANLDRPGPRWPIGAVTVSGSAPLAVTFHVAKHWLSPVSAVATPSPLIATRLQPDDIVALHSACGRSVDWYRIG